MPYPKKNTIKKIKTTLTEIRLRFDKFGRPPRYPNYGAEKGQMKHETKFLMRPDYKPYYRMKEQYKPYYRMKKEY